MKGKAIKLLLTILMVIGILPCASRTAYADNGSLAGTIIRPGDTLTLNGDFIEIYQGYVTAYKNSYTLTSPDKINYDSDSGVWIYTLRSSDNDWQDFKIAGPQEPKPQGFKVVSGDGKSAETAYRLDLFYPEYPLWVGGVQVNSANKDNIPGTEEGTASFDPAKNILTLDGAIISKTHPFKYDYDDHSACIYTTLNKLTINVVNTSIIGNSTSGDGIFSENKLTISGSGTLNVNANGENDCAIFSEEEMSIAGGTINAVARGNNGVAIDSEEELYIEGGTVTAVAENDAHIAIFGKNYIDISDGSVTVTTSNERGSGILGESEIDISGGKVRVAATGEYARGIEANVSITIGKNADLTASGSQYAIKGKVYNAINGTGWTDIDGTKNETNISSSSEGQALTNYRKVQFPAIPGYPLWVGGVQVTDGNKDDIPGTVSGKASFDPATNTLTLNDAVITGSHVYFSTDDAAIFSSGIDLTIIAEGNSTVGSTDVETGIYTTEENETGGTLNIKGDGTLNATGWMEAIVTDGDLNINDNSGSNCTVTARIKSDKGDTVVLCNGTLAMFDGSLIATARSNEYRYVTPIYAAYGVDLEGGNVTAIPTEEDAVGYGIYIEQGNIMIGKNATLTAAGTRAAMNGMVINAVAGTGWTDVEGTKGKSNIDADTEKRALEYKKVQFPVVDEYPVWVGGVQATSANKDNILGTDSGKASFDPETNTLTLNGAVITGSYTYLEGHDASIYTALKDTLNIVLIGNNNVGSDNIETGIYVTDKNGGGGLNIKGNNASLSVRGKLDAISAEDDLNINDANTDCSITAVADSDSADTAILSLGSITIADGNITAKAGGSEAIYALDAVTINGGNVTAVSSDRRVVDYGIHTSNGDITIGEDVTLTASGVFGALLAYDHEVINLVPGTGWTDKGQEAIKVSKAGQDLTAYKKVEFPTIIKYPLWLGEVQVTNANEDDVLKDGKVVYTPAEGTTPAKLTLKGANVSDTHPFIFIGGLEAEACIYTPKSLIIELENGTENIIGNAAGGFGICVDGDLTIQGKGTLKTSSASEDEAAVICGGKLTINDGNITASSSGNDSAAVNAADISINGGTIIASASGENSNGLAVPADSGVIEIGTDVSLTASGTDVALYGKVSNSIKGTGWEDTQEKKEIPVKTGQTLSYKKVMFPAVVNYDLWVGGVQVDSSNKDDIPGTDQGKASYDPDTNTLTLDGVIITRTNPVEGESYTECIFTRKDLIINVAEGTQNQIGNSSRGSGIFVHKSLTIKGKGSLTVTAAGDGENAIVCNVLTVSDVKLTASANDDGIYGFDDIIINSGTIEAVSNGQHYGINAEYGNIEIKEDARLIASGQKAAMYGIVKNAISGTGWADTAGTQEKEDIKVNAGKALDYRKVQFPAYIHEHSFIYSASGATITATCQAENCDLPENMVSFTLTEPTLTVYGGSGSAQAGLSGVDDFNTATGKAISSDDIEYYENGTKLNAAPSDAGDYEAQISVSGVTASISYSISPRSFKDNCKLKIDADSYSYTGKDITPVVAVSDPSLQDKKLVKDTDYTLSGDTAASLPGKYTITVTGKGNYNDTSLSIEWTIEKGKALLSEVPVAAPISSGQSLAESSFTGGKVTGTDGKSISGSFAFEDPAITPAVSDSDKTLYSVIFTPDGQYASIYDPLKFKITITVNKKEQSAPQNFTSQNESLRGKNDGSITINDPIDNMEYYYVLTDDTETKPQDVTKAVLSSLSPGIYYFRYKENAEEKASPYTSVIVTEGEKIKITFNNHDGSRLQETALLFNEMPQYTGITPTKEKDAQYSYTFKGWDKPLVPATQDTVYTATYDQTLNSYDITFINDDDSLIDVIKVEYGKTPSHDDPTKAEDEQYTYSFSGWQPGLAEVTGDATYKATYTTQTKQYKITFVDDDGKIIQVDGMDYKEYPYGTAPSAIVKPTVPSKTVGGKTYDFFDWKPDVNTVTEDQIYKAVYVEHFDLYTAKWIDIIYDYEEKGSKEEIVQTVDKPTKISELVNPDPKNPKQTTISKVMTFLDWGVTQQGDQLIFTAFYKPVDRRFIISWLDGDDNLLKQDDLLYGTEIQYNGVTPTKTATEKYSYSFNGSWQPNVDHPHATKDYTFTAQFTETINRYKVTFVDDDGRLISGPTEYDYETSAKRIEKPADPAKEPGIDKVYTFNGWKDKDSGEAGLKDVTKDVVYVADYTSSTRKYNILFVNDDGSRIEQQELEYGIVPACSATPSKEADKRYTYTFTGWDPELSAVSKDVTYKAVYSAKPRLYVISFEMAVYDPVEQQILEYGKTVAKPADPVAEGYEFLGWYRDPQFKNKWDFDSDTVSGNTTIYAGYTGSAYKVRLYPKGGSIKDEYINVYYGKPYGELPVPVKQNVIFDGWYKEASFTNKVEATDIYELKEDSSLYARYKYPVHLRQLDGTVDTIYVYDDLEHMADPGKAPDKNGYIFDYWALSSTEQEFDFNNDKPLPDMTLVAKYHKYEYSGITNTWIKDDRGLLRFRFLRYEHIFHDDLSMLNLKALFEANNRQLFVDDVLLNEDQYEYLNGSLIINLKDTYLNSLSLGTHKLTVRFKDGEASTSFIIKERVKPSTPDYVIPKTGN